jgi:hypothetical protein
MRQFNPVHSILILHFPLSLIIRENIALTNISYAFLLSSCLFGSNRHRNSAPYSVLLVVVFTRINDFRVSVSVYPVVASGNYHPPSNFDFKFTFHSQPTFLTSRRNYGQGDYLLLYNTLTNLGWCCGLNENSLYFTI